MNDKDKTTKKTVSKKDNKAKPVSKIDETNSVKEIKTKEVKPKKTAASISNTAVTEPEVKSADSQSLIEEFDVDAVSSSKPKKLTPLKSPASDAREEIETAEITAKDAGEKEKLSPIFKELAEPKLPSLPAENRAFLQMQSPNRIFFYWSIKGNPYETLYKGLGSRAENYQLIVKLINLSNNNEEFYPVESSGSWWFNVQSNSSYRAEVGFLAPNRPFIRLVFSNVLETPRSQPSPNRDYSTFTVSANQFAEVLEAAGFTQDAFDVYLAGDDVDFADTATQKAFIKIIGGREIDFAGINLNELRYVLFALASGVSLSDLRERITPELFVFLAKLTDENSDTLSEEKVILALEEFFGINFAEEEIDEEYFSSAVYGASLINFPQGVRKHKSRFAPNKWELSPISSAASK